MTTAGLYRRNAFASDNGHDAHESDAHEAGIGCDLKVLVVNEMGRRPIGSVEVKETVRPDSGQRGRKPLMQATPPFGRTVLIARSQGPEADLVMRQKSNADGSAHGKDTDEDPDDSDGPVPRTPTPGDDGEGEGQDEHRSEPWDRVVVRGGGDGGDTQRQPRHERHGERPKAAGGDEKAAAGDGQERTTTLGGEEAGEVEADDDADDGRSPCAAEGEEKTDAEHQPGGVGVCQ